jgi:hypothetical protein
MSSGEDIAARLFQRQVGLGLLPLAIEGRPSVIEARRVLDAAQDVGVRRIGTADVYGQIGEPPGYAEELLASVPTRERELRHRHEGRAGQGQQFSPPSERIAGPPYRRV